MEKKRTDQKEPGNCKKEEQHKRREGKIFETRLTRHMDELKWLYMELYDSTEHFESLFK